MKKSTRDSIEKMNITLSSAAMNLMPKYTMKKIAKAKSICSVVTSCHGRHISKSWKCEVSGNKEKKQ